MRRSRHTTIIEFIVINPHNSNESKGEILKLSYFGEYCPDNSVRGYSLLHLLTHPNNYSIFRIRDKGNDMLMLNALK